MRGAFAAWLSVTGIGLILLIVGYVLLGQYDNRPTVDPSLPPSGFAYVGEPNEVVYLSPDKSTYHRLNCPHLTGKETQSLVQKLPKGAVPCATCMVEVPRPVKVDAPRLYWASLLTRIGGVVLLIVGGFGLVFDRFNRPPAASFAPGFPVERGPE